MNMQNSGASEYSRVGSHSGIQDASPHQLIQMLMEGGLKRIDEAIGHMQGKNIAAKGLGISKAVSIVDGLRGSLDMKQGGEIAQNLNNLYAYMINRLIDANMKNDVDALKEVHTLLSEIKSGWDGIEGKVKNAARADEGSHPKENINRVDVAG